MPFLKCVSKKHEELAHLVHVGPGLGRCLHVLHAPLLRFAPGLLHRHLPPLLQVWFVSHHEQWNFIFFSLNTEDLFPKVLHPKIKTFFKKGFLKAEEEIATCRAYPKDTVPRSCHKLDKGFQSLVLQMTSVLITNAFFWAPQ